MRPSLTAVLATAFAGLFAGWTLFAADGAEEGRTGNAHYREAAYPEAARAYERGLAERDDPAARTATNAALWTNLALALHRADSTERAARAFRDALRTAPDSAARARAAYNAGTATAQLGADSTSSSSNPGNALAGAIDRDEAALAYLRQALLADPSHDRARFNFELVKRQLQRRKKEQDEQNQQQQRDQPPVQPSPFAERLKTRADSLVARRQYRDAFQLMQRGLRRDSTVAAFRSFIQRTGTVAQIDTLSAP